mmetsp:Transcript_113085/g.196358  ORF Transcript_113085/g.196358 Transcript_113085/m.196358 type:complete len:81 (-) Transcript_113085:1184-1426(-)
MQALIRCAKRKRRNVCSSPATPPTRGVQGDKQFKCGTDLLCLSAERKAKRTTAASGLTYREAASASGLEAENHTLNLPPV